MTSPVPGLALVALLIGAAPPVLADFVTLASTTSTQNSGLLDDLLPRFTTATGIDVRVVAVGSGQALRLGARCDADLLLVHDREAEERFLAKGHGVARHDLMYNDFVLVGPRADPAGVRAASHVVSALRGIARREAPFASRGDRSGTHTKELALWREAAVDVSIASGAWYRETGSGMGATLNAAAAMDAYTLADRAAWLAFENRADLELLSEGDPRLRNPYSILRVSEARCPSTKSAHAQRLVEWLLSAEGQRAIAGFRVAGEPVFFPARLAPPP
jgi:tungstate transport system substrate-binding protein